MPGPYLRARTTNDYDKSLEVGVCVGDSGSGYVTLHHPTSELVFAYLGIKRLILSHD